MAVSGIYIQVCFLVLIIILFLQHVLLLFEVFWETALKVFTHTHFDTLPSAYEHFKICSFFIRWKRLHRPPVHLALHCEKRSREPRTPLAPPVRRWLHGEICVAGGWQLCRSHALHITCHELVNPAERSCSVV